MVGLLIKNINVVLVIFILVLRLMLGQLSHLWYYIAAKLGSLGFMGFICSLRQPAARASSTCRVCPHRPESLRKGAPRLHTMGKSAVRHLALPLRDEESIVRQCSAEREENTKPVAPPRPASPQPGGLAAWQPSPAQPSPAR